jgi:hypothetical protein
LKSASGKSQAQEKGSDFSRLLPRVGRTVGVKRDRVKFRAVASPKGEAEGARRVSGT